LVAKVGVVQVFRLAALAQRHLDGGRACVNLDELSVEPDLLL
jgi:hypothetical protein